QRIRALHKSRTPEGGGTGVAQGAGTCNWGKNPPNPRRGWHRCSPGRKPCGWRPINTQSPVGATQISTEDSTRNGPYTYLSRYAYGIQHQGPPAHDRFGHSAQAVGVYEWRYREGGRQNACNQWYGRPCAFARVASTYCGGGRSDASGESQFLKMD